MLGHGGYLALCPGGTLKRDILYAAAERLKYRLVPDDPCTQHLRSYRAEPWRVQGSTKCSGGSCHRPVNAPGLSAGARASKLWLNSFIRQRWRSLLFHPEGRAGRPSVLSVPDTRPDPQLQSRSVRPGSCRCITATRGWPTSSTHPPRLAVGRRHHFVYAQPLHPPLNPPIQIVTADRQDTARWLGLVSRGQDQPCAQEPRPAHAGYVAGAADLLRAPLLTYGSFRIRYPRAVPLWPLPER